MTDCCLECSLKWIILVQFVHDQYRRLVDFGGAAGSPYISTVHHDFCSILETAGCWEQYEIAPCIASTIQMASNVRYSS